MVAKVISIDEIFTKILSRSSSEIPDVQLGQDTVTDRGKIDQLLRLTLTYWNGGDRAKATELLRDAQKQPEYEPSLRLAFAALLFEIGDYAGSLSQLDTIVSKQPGRIDARLLRANVRMAANYNEGARSDLEFIVQQPTKDLDLLANVGILYNEMGDHETALEILEPFNTPNTTNVKGLEVLGRALVEVQANQAALEVLRRAVELGSNSSESYLNLGIAQTSLGQQLEAVASWRRALELDPSNEVTRWNLGVALMLLGNRSEALDILRGLISRSQAWETMSMQYGSSLFGTGNYAQALDMFGVVAACAPKTSVQCSALNFVAVCECFLGRLREAERSLTRAQSLDRQNPATYYNFGLLLAAQGRYREAKLAYETAKTKDANSIEREAAVVLLRRYMQEVKSNDSLENLVRALK